MSNYPQRTPTSNGSTYGVPRPSRGCGPNFPSHLPTNDHRMGQRPVERKSSFAYTPTSSSSFRVPNRIGMHTSTSAPDGFGRNGRNFEEPHKPVVRMVTIERTEETITSNSTTKSESVPEPGTNRAALVQNGGTNFQRPSFPLPSTIQENIPLDTHRNQCYKKVSFHVHYIAVRVAVTDQGKVRFRRTVTGPISATGGQHNFPKLSCCFTELEAMKPLDSEMKNLFISCVSFSSSFPQKYKKSQSITCSLMCPECRFFLDT